MSRYRHLPIWKAAMQLAVHLEQAVKRLMQAIPGLPASRNLRLSKFAPGEFVSRYHKYTLGSELRLTAQRICRLVARANDARGEGRVRALDELVGCVEEMKTLLTLAQEVRAFASFNEFSGAAELAVSLGKQSRGWRRRVRPEASSQTSVRG